MFSNDSQCTAHVFSLLKTLQSRCVKWTSVIQISVLTYAQITADSREYSCNIWTIQYFALTDSFGARYLNLKLSHTSLILPLKSTSLHTSISISFTVHPALLSSCRFSCFVCLFLFVLSSFSHDMAECSSPRGSHVPWRSLGRRRNVLQRFPFRDKLFL